MVEQDAATPRRVRRSPFVTIAAVNGAAFGAGADLVAACIYRIAGPAARFRFPGFRFGVALGTRHLRSLVGPQQARNILLEDRTISADEAAAIGLVTHRIEAEQQPKAIAAIVSRITPLEPQSAADIIRLTGGETDDSDLANLVRSVSRPGLHDRMARYPQLHARS